MRDRWIVLLFVVLAGGVVAGASTMVLRGDLAFGRFSHNCGLDDPLRSIAPDTDATALAREGSQSVATRTLTYAANGGAALDLAGCVSTGALVVGVSPDARLHVEVTLRAPAPNDDAARAAAHAFDPSVRSDGGRLLVFEPARSWTWGQPTASMAARILVPAAMLVTADLGTGTGSIRVDGPRLGGLDASTGTGTIELDPSWAEGRFDLSTGTGHIRGRFPALGNATFDASTGTSSIALVVRGDARHGYDVDASAGTGSVRVDLPDLEREEVNHNSVEARTRDFGDRAVQVRIDASTGTGSVTITTI